MSLLVDRLDRLSRNTKTIEEIILGMGVIVVAVSDEPSTDPLVLASRAARAELEGNIIAERTKRALTDRKASGVLLGNRTNLPEAQKLGADSNRRRADEKANEIADAISSNGWHDLSVPALVDALNELPLLSSRGGPWTVAALRRPHRAALKVLRKPRLDDYQHHPGFGQF
ncbi:recombinase family protein [Rhizobium ruizarguesonis]|uniref:recombinase family protein n=1 Tax=Rhizobium ruizarguesonis TaxID=2081791 RepID=UPI0013EED40E|nr:recombinase family protein [Rhizobium ruizarguesonis]